LLQPLRPLVGEQDQERAAAVQQNAFSLARIPTITEVQRCALAFLLRVAACESPTGVLVTLPNGARLHDAPAIYQRWWAMMASCANSSASLKDVRWYFTEGDVVPNPAGERVSGYYEPGSHRVVLAGNGAYVGGVVRHEMLHAISRNARHDRATFLARCAGLVDCDFYCVRDAGPAPAADMTAVRVAPTALAIAVDVSRASVSQRDSDDFFEIVVSATNPLPHPIVVDLPASGDDGPPDSFSYRLASVDGSSIQWYDERAWDTSASRFAAGEMKRWVFDTKASFLRATSYEADGLYGNVPAAQRRAVTVTP